MNAVFWFAFGAFVGIDAALAYAWLTTRRARRQRELRWRVMGYTGSRRPW